MSRRGGGERGEEGVICSCFPCHLSHLHRHFKRLEKATPVKELNPRASRSKKKMRRQDLVAHPEACCSCLQSVRRAVILLARYIFFSASGFESVHVFFQYLFFFFLLFSLKSRSNSFSSATSTSSTFPPLAAPPKRSW